MELIEIKKFERSSPATIRCGRFIGLIDKHGFTALMENKDLCRKIVNSESLPLNSLSDIAALNNDYRCVFVCNKTKLYITEPLDMLYSYKEKDTGADISITGRKSWWHLKCKKET